MGTATLYRGPHYGALAVVLDDDITTIDHGIEEPALDAALGVLSQYCECRVEGDGRSSWKAHAHPATVMSSLDGAMRRLGYQQNPLAERAILRTTPEEAEAPDLPTSGKFGITESVERGILALASLAEAAMCLDDTTTSCDVWARPNATDPFGRPLPFARVLIRGFGHDASAAEEAMRQALSHTEGLVRATVKDAGGILEAEFAVAFPGSVVEEFADRVLRPFPPANDSREVTLSVGADVPDWAWRDIEERAHVCGAVLEMARGRRTVTARVPSAEIPDMVFSDRVRWLVNEFREWGSSLEEIRQVGA